MCLVILTPPHPASCQPISLHILTPPHPAVPSPSTSIMCLVESAAARAAHVFVDTWLSTRVWATITLQTISIELNSLCVPWLGLSAGLHQSSASASWVLRAQICGPVTEPYPQYLDNFFELKTTHLLHRPLIKHELFLFQWRYLGFHMNRVNLKDLMDISIVSG